MPSADTNTITIIGNATNPSFSREQLPVSRKVGKDGFSARWEIRHTVGGYNVCEYVGADFLLGVDRYQKVCRAIKYIHNHHSDFFSVFFTETNHAPPNTDVQLLPHRCGSDPVLLSAAGTVRTHVIGASYLIAAVMTITLITCYMWKMLGSKAVGLAYLRCALSIMYGSAMAMLCISTYALCSGSLLLFVALAATMYGSLKIQYR